MATAGDSGVSGTAADTATLSPEQLHKHLLAWGIPALRVDRRSRQLADLGVTIQGLAVQPLNMLQVLLAEGGQATKADMFDAGVIKDGATKAAAGAASSNGHAGAMSEVQVQQDAVAVQLQQQLQVQQRQLQLLQQIANNTSNTQRLLLVSRHRYTPSQASKIRDPTFKKRLAEVYQCTEPEPSAEPKKLRCMLLDRFLPSNVVCGSHLFKYSWHEDVSNTLGFTNINDTRNGLLLFKPLEEAFDNGYLVFLPAGDNFTAHWLGDDSSQLAQPPFPWNMNSLKQGMQDEPDTLPASIRTDFKGTTFKEVVEGKQLHFRNEHRPYKRCLSYQARKAVAAALSTGRISEDWLQGKTLVFHSPAASNIEDYFASIPPEGADVPPEAGSIPHDDSSLAENVTNSDS